MNAELSAKGLSKIIIPTVYREDYMGALRKLTRQRVADAYVRMLLRAYEFSSTLRGESIDEMEKHLIKCDAFKEPKEGKLKILEKFTWNGIRMMPTQQSRHLKTLWKLVEDDKHGCFFLGDNAIPFKDVDLALFLAFILHHFQFRLHTFRRNQF